MSLLFLSIVIARSISLEAIPGFSIGTYFLPFSLMRLPHVCSPDLAGKIFSGRLIFRERVIFFQGLTGEISGL